MKHIIEKSRKLLIILSLTLMIPSSTIASKPDINKILKRIERESGCKLRVTSGYRTKSHNKRVGGAPNSFHLSDRARDFRSKYRNEGVVSEGWQELLANIQLQSNTNGTYILTTEKEKRDVGTADTNRERNR